MQPCDGNLSVRSGRSSGSCVWLCVVLKNFGMRGRLKQVEKYGQHNEPLKRATQHDEEQRVEEGEEDVGAAARKAQRCDEGGQGTIHHRDSGLLHRLKHHERQMIVIPKLLETPAGCQQHSIAAADVKLAHTVY